MDSRRLSALPFPAAADLHLKSTRGMQPPPAHSRKPSLAPESATGRGLARPGCGLARAAGPSAWHQLRLACLVFAALAGCATPELPRQAAWRAHQPAATATADFNQQCLLALTDDLKSLAPWVAPAEAETLARAALAAAAALRQSYRPVRPAWLNNTLVNFRLKSRGLCYQWADDLGARLVGLSLATLHLHRAVARRGGPREHSGLVVTAVHQPFKQGIILDAWRYGGILFWDFVWHDSYPWVRLDDEASVQARQAASAVRNAEP